MTPARWSRIKEVFGPARERPEPEPPPFLRRPARERAEVEKLLGEDSASLVSPLREREYKPGDAVGHYQVEGKLARVVEVPFKNDKAEGRQRQRRYPLTSQGLRP
jgi:hypothetical protein